MMSDHPYCDICKEPNVGDNWVIVISEDKEKFQINGHKKCIDELHIKIMSVKSLDKKPIKKVLKEVKFKVD